MGDIDYIQPNQIGYTKLSKEQRVNILKSERKYIKRILRTVALSAIVMFLLYMGYDSIFISKNFNIEFIGPVIMYTAFTVTSIRLTTQVKHTASAYGIVVKKDVIKQRVLAGINYRYRRYISDPVHTDRPTVEQDFYYLTVKLADGRYVRYVNCLREDFISVSEGDKVLAVCYGFNEIKGYVI